MTELAVDEPTGVPLVGYTIGITAARRREEFGVALERRGATVRYGPAIRIVPLLDDADLLAATKECLREPLDLAVITTGIGYRGWVEAADAWGLGEDLLKALSSATLLARGPKVRGAVRASGLREAWSPESESSTEMLDHLLTQVDLVGKRVAIQLHGEPVPGMVEALVAARAQVIEVPVYRWVPPTDVEPLRQLIRAVVSRGVQSVAFTSAPAATNFLRTADSDGVGEAVRTALQSDVIAACVGSVTAAPLVAQGIPVIQPERFRLGALVREIAIRIPERFTRRLTVAGAAWEIRGQGVAVDGAYLPLSSDSLALLRALAEKPGQIVPGAEGAIERLRTELGRPDLVESVGGGYRLAVQTSP